MKEDILVSQGTDRTSRKVTYASNGAAGGAGVGALLGFVLAPRFDSIVEAAAGMSVPDELTGAVCLTVVSSAVAWITALKLGYHVRERLENMIAGDSNAP